MKRGDIVKYSQPADDNEAAFRFVLLREPQKDRVDIQLICQERINRSIELASFDHNYPKAAELHVRD